jgi:ribosomal protein L14E/L6E/L27E
LRRDGVLTVRRMLRAAAVAGVERAPKKVTKAMSKKKFNRKTSVKPFVKSVNYNHIMPTRYTLDVADKLKQAVSDDSLSNVEKKKLALKAVKVALDDRYQSRSRVGVCERRALSPWVLHAGVASRQDVARVPSLARWMHFVALWRPSCSRGPAVWCPLLRVGWSLVCILSRHPCCCVSPRGRVCYQRVRGCEGGVVCDTSRSPAASQRCLTCVRVCVLAVQIQGSGYGLEREGDGWCQVLLPEASFLGS